MLFKEITELASVSLQKVKCVTYERYKLFTNTQGPGESLEAFHAALSAQAARSVLENLENENHSSISIQPHFGKLPKKII